MRKTITGLMLLVLLASCQEVKTNNPISKQTKSNDIMDKQNKQQIEALLQEYKKSLNSSEAELASSLYSKDGVFMPTEAPSATGTEQIKGAYEFVFSQIQLTIEFYIDEIVIEGDMAFATTTSKGTTLIHANGQTVPEENRELFVFEKINGNWKIARYMFNKMKPQA
jgi:uncharacterized protein (TIGR02246 family)